MKTVQQILPESEICHIIKCVDKDDILTLTHLRKMIDSKELAAGALLRGTIKQYCKGCVCKETVYILVGICLQFGATIDECTLCCIDALEMMEKYGNNNPSLCKQARITERNCTFKEVKRTLIIMSNVSRRYGICPLSQEMRNWLGSVLNRNDMFEGGIGPIPCVFMKECKCDTINSSLARSIATGSDNFYKGMVHYAKLVDCGVYNKMLKQIVDLGIKFLDLTPILYAIQEGGDVIKLYVTKAVGEVEPKDESMREGLIRLSNVIAVM